jgi:pimeloyl-ACP methyl ester carboxylesterase
MVCERIYRQRDFWKNGLRLAWGDPKLVSESDALRFQWPSIGRGWEKGLLAFTRAKLFAVDKYNTGNGEGDFALLRDVLALPHTSVCILHGDKDTVISSKMIQSIVQTFPQIPLVQLQGQGHDPFEEQIDTFVSAVLALLPSHDDEI